MRNNYLIINVNLLNMKGIGGSFELVMFEVQIRKKLILVIEDL